MLFWAFLLKKFRFWSVYNSTYNELAHLDDRTLADINVRRAEIGTTARRAALRSIAA
ncbi:DUF1127 domain-containing protein [Hansschlegelia sp. KR7-227]|jgi:uncharacterized protein YjiS (DUF1127 family)|uniref:DUF1127 domain-containing protein n=1 Tax=Hansschlegelia sp. KR7-227 TaxID=3400914 RepID=UPI003BFCCF4B